MKVSAYLINQRLYVLIISLMQHIYWMWLLLYVYRLSYLVPSPSYYNVSILPSNVRIFYVGGMTCGRRKKCLAMLSTAFLFNPFFFFPLFVSNSIQEYNFTFLAGGCASVVRADTIENYGQHRKRTGF